MGNRDLALLWFYGLMKPYWANTYDLTGASLSDYFLYGPITPFSPEN